MVLVYGIEETSYVNTSGLSNIPQLELEKQSSHTSTHREAPVSQECQRNITFMPLMQPKT